MSSGSAHVSSIAAVGTFKLALRRFEAEVLAAISQLELESRRPMEWLEGDRAPYWRRAQQRAGDAVAEARLALERCESSPGEDGPRFCHDERKQLEKAQRRLRLAESKVRCLRQWAQTIRKEVEEFQVQLVKLRLYLENDVPRAVATLDRLGSALERYAALGASGASGEAKPSP